MRPLARSLLPLCLAALAWLLVACPVSTPQWPEDDGFDDHTFARVEDRADFNAHAAVGATGTAVLKFVIVGFGEPNNQHLRYLDGRFYEFHDEWYWFRLLNGQQVPGSRERPVSGHEFETVDEITQWVRARSSPPPLGMRIIDERLYSDYFYEIAVHRERRALGIGTIVHFPARAGEHPRDERWGFELEYSDKVEAEELELFFATLSSSLPDELGERLEYIARSPAQDQLVARLRAHEHPLASRLTKYAELAVPGEIEVYNPGLIAGRLRKLPADPEQAAAVLTEGNAGVIWMMPSVPDELPAAAGLLTAVPQTPLAHVNLLARNRGIPNAYVGGLFEDPQLDQLSRVHAPVVILADGSRELTIEPISEEAYGQWRALARERPPTLDPVDPTTLPYTLDLDREAPARVPELRGIVGGKAAGFVVLHAAGTTMPERPLAITTRAYHEHIHELRALLEHTLSDPTFNRDGRARYLLLEGREDFDARFASAADQAWVREFIEAHPPQTAKRDPIAKLLIHDGIKRAIRERPLSAPAAEAIDRALRAHFGHFAPSQGLRFRSSSTVEDVEGFSGAGLYDSNTGFLHPEAQARERDQKKSAEWAIKKTWASYWSWEAFEERRLTGIDHLDGDMAVLVHARFDDELERSNGVLTLTLDLSGDRRGAVQAPGRVRASMEVDVQLGALSVTNPPPDRAGEVLPEVDRVTLARVGEPVRIERVSRSTELASGDVLHDATLDQLFRDSLAIAERWLEIENRRLPSARARGRVTLDIEFREVAAGWPGYASATPASARMVIKQVRSLDPGVPSGAEQLLDQPIPRDLVVFADRIERRSCRGSRTRVDLLEVWTDPMAPRELDHGHGRVPFVARVRVDARGLEGGARRFDLDHLELAAVEHPGLDRGAPWAATLSLDPAAGVAVDRIEISAGLLRVFAGGRLLSEEPAPCSVDVAFASPDGFLRGLLGR
ncbi:PEP/pyruvate-binding domain-containing protein [Enhygromyxa salina]|uniref:PEP/pyruvate-binding domain-containing protein n=1 Tax=Enhygromyxa salina TaxID=215803 RepID=UPI0011B29524|nr:PEP/pyruvate-binding domain-containing protein [Enhygromyxa salina]